ncbi:hypothetical protein K9L67_04710 [Candidatus Woesearchaeota archaeon]|nr:hypothetical protein [Candidatus Woesearchaeota archaeon]MCF7901501.1 hypothetical protein [Candidatus Woesearchaeota archaeon]MCF8013923.1 hypothetical protein [Candidatus Woesearchaeota archaeon]
MNKTKVTELKQIDEFLIKYAKLIDDVDMYTGPFFEARHFTNSEAFHALANTARTIEYSLKIPFIALYLGRTKDYMALAEFIPKEIFALNVPYGGLIQIFRRYEKVTKQYYNIK